jgi:hypothetical protein
MIRYYCYLVALLLLLFGILTIMGSDYATRHSAENPRLFQQDMKKECWNKSTLVAGRDPERWRRDAVGNIICRKLTGCEGCLCHEYDHIVPYSKGGKTEGSNCQILQSRVNRMKGNKDQNLEEMKLYSCERKFTEKELDVIEMALYGDVKRMDFHCRCKSIMEMTEAWDSMKKSQRMKEYDRIPACK